MEMRQADLKSLSVHSKKSGESAISMRTWYMMMGIAQITRMRIRPNKRCPQLNIIENRLLSSKNKICCSIRQHSKMMIMIHWKSES